ncbi:MAG: valine--tRNA ligase [Candidatus Kerfeldbacteria bacterium RIFCSPLOWO2_01_FULL_48_11]|uniref:Valine--tRNA ligase n=1 Tax=Candidatus Kerfeldbacteria bacterium RIFCSPLOWO2_01_FULL_48_11 TaxID=1798543 RepID=A0A1G2B158_9BACT|nr:MAG: valine--tRNA ligase [Candidatus Kerfeldbacteria bacterium RIFCSPLOWO2_01_FULL_48_11]HCJ52332.1 valine--tRNA ligase [Candidatus Kerfeldbacteria bacterium]
MTFTMKLSKAYEPQSIEANIYKRWERSGFFNPDKLPGKRMKPFAISMPPPNVTGELHLGHATGMTLEDIMIRHKRMQGYKTLWLPGTDHAGISTQIMVERLIASEGVNRHALGRDKFLKRVWQWKKQYGTHITQQIRQIGASCDWSREHFTMDPKLTAAVQHAFVTMYNDGLIYRGKRIINWCPRCLSAISDLEVKHEPRKHKLYFLRYKLAGGAAPITVATTRPETMLGDTAVAVNPKDERYKSFVGKKVTVPIVEREVPVIADRGVEQEFGTGAVKVTPAHDALDYEIGLRNELPIISVIDEHAHMTKEAGIFVGKSTVEARRLILEELQEGGHIEKIEDYEHNVATCDRCHTEIEPLISLQWFVKTAPLAKKAIAAVKTGKIHIVPARFEKVYFHWMNNIRDWCISRQLWWGHQIPIWYNGDKVKASVAKPAGKGWKQDPDTLDTWFSSGLWTFATLGWPKKTKGLTLYHPTSVMETGWDILFFWVARMIMMSMYFMKEVPFKTVYLHGLVLDKDGKKMSKSKGTGIDPIPMTQKYGTDAIRLSLVLGTAAGQDVRLYEEKISSYRNFINKLWNIARFTLTQPKETGVKPKTLADAWILSRLQTVTKETTGYLESFRFSEAGTLLYDFLWHELADWYIEITKVAPNAGVLRHVLLESIKLLHPFTPFVTEELWSHLTAAKGTKDMLMVTSWPETQQGFVNAKAESDFSIIREFIVAVRNARSNAKVPPHVFSDVCAWGKHQKLLQEHQAIIERLTRIKLTCGESDAKPTGVARGMAFALAVTEETGKRQESERAQLTEYIKRLEHQLANEQFVKNAPQQVVEGQRSKLKETRNRLDQLK